MHQICQFLNLQWQIAMITLSSLSQVLQPHFFFFLPAFSCCSLSRLENCFLSTFDSPPRILLQDSDLYLMTSRTSESLFRWALGSQSSYGQDRRNMTTKWAVVSFSVRHFSWLSDKLLVIRPNLSRWWSLPCWFMNSVTAL